jgi:hypothetical protein
VGRRRDVGRFSVTVPKGWNDTHILILISGDPTEPGVMEILDSLEGN